MDVFLLLGGLIYLCGLIIFRKFFKVSSYYAIVVIILLIISIVLIKLNIEDIGKHTAHGAPLFMLLFAAYVSSLLLSLVFVCIDMIIWYLKIKKRGKI